MKDGSDDDGDNQPLIKRVRLVGYRRDSNILTVVISKSNVFKSPSEGSEKGKNAHIKKIYSRSIIKAQNESSQRARLWCGY